MKFSTVLPKSSFANGVSILAGGTAVSQILLVISSPILTRLYTPEDFGIFSVFLSLVAMSSIFATLRYELAIPLSANTPTAMNIVLLCLILLTINTALLSATVLFTYEYFGEVFNVKDLNLYFFIFPVAVFLTGINTVFNYLGLQIKAFPLITISKIYQSIFTVITQITAFNFGFFALMFGNLTGMSIGTLKLGIGLFKNFSLRDLKMKQIIAVAIRYKRFPMFSVMSGFINTAGVHLPPILFALYFSSSAAGIYALTNRILTLPMRLIGESVGKTFFAHAPSLNETGQLGNQVYRVHIKLSELGMPVFLLIFFLGPELFQFAFGTSWFQSGELARLMAPWLYLVFVTSPMTSLFSIIEKQAQSLIFQIILFLTRIGALIIGALYLELVATVAIFSLASTICWLGFLLWLCRVCNINILSILTAHSKTFCIAALMCAPIVFVSNVQIHLPGTSLFGTLLSFMLLSIYYYRIMKSFY